mgnify:CR=1 FL=1|tara:strand:+ start:734 stop:1030 length:297 start_codon:yes stop_codon:yes gene_type:complete
MKTKITWSKRTGHMVGGMLKSHTTLKLANKSASSTAGTTSENIQERQPASVIAPNEYMTKKQKEEMLNAGREKADARGKPHLTKAENDALYWEAHKKK